MPIRWRLTIFYTLTILLIAGLLTAALFAVRAIGLVTQLEGTVRAHGLEASRIIASGGTLEQADAARLTADGVFLIARDEQGAIVAQAGAVIPDAFAPTIWQRALAAGEPVATGGGGTKPYVYAIPVAPAGSPVRVVEAGTTFDVIGEGFVLFAPLVGAAVILVVLIAIGGSYLLAWSAFRPVNAIVRSARAITEGDLSQRLPVKSRRDELGRLALAFNDLLGRLEVAFDQRAEALERQRRFVSDAGHELRTPLTSILGYTRMLREWGLKDPAIAREGITAMEREAERMEALVKELLGLARGDEQMPLDRRAYDLGDLAATAVEAARAAAGAKVRIDYDPPFAPVRAIGDRDRIRQAVGALLDNAVKYTPAGGLVTVSVRDCGDAAELEVADTGVGIAMRHLPHIFDRFYRVDEARSTGGMGLGLAIVRQIAEAHGGTVTVVSQPASGSTFTLRLPAAAGEPSAAARSV